MNVNKIKVLPSCSLIEILLKNKNNHSKINSIIDFIFEKEIYICRSQYAYFNTKTLANLRSMDPICRNIFFKKEINIKIDSEAQLMTLFISSIVICFSTVVSHEFNLNCNAYYNSTAKLMVKECDVMKKIIVESLKKGYDSNFNKQAGINIWKKILRIFYKVIYDTAYDCNGRTIEYKKLKFSKILKSAFNNNSINQMMKINSKDIKFKVKVLINDIVKKIGSEKQYHYEYIQIRYMEYLMNNWMIDGKKFDKNDIYDIYYFFSCSDFSLKSLLDELQSEYQTKKKKIIWVTFDEKMYIFLEQFSKMSYIYIYQII